MSEPAHTARPAPASSSPTGMMPIIGGPPEADPMSPRKLGTFAGVFRPIILTMLGMMLFLRTGWVVGNAGLMGALAVLVLAFFISGATAFSVSTIATNIRLGTGGAFSLVSRSLGLEAGGAIGVPLYLALALGGALYIYGFAEAWGFIFPDHPKWAVVLGLYLIALLIASVNARWVFQLHMPALVVLVLAIASMWGNFFVQGPAYEPRWVGEFQAGDFWRVFGVFFPATSGIMVGLSMSGGLEDTRRSVPRGVLAAWGTGFVGYALTMVWFAMMVSPQALVASSDVAVTQALVPWAVQVGILTVCVTATLGALVASPQVLYALAANRLIPYHAHFSKKTAAGNYRNATLLTGALIGLTLLLGDLDRVARVITMFFLVTYATLNFVLVIEQSLALISFRPTLKVPTIVPILGAAASILAMMITSPTFGLVAIGLVATLYFYLASRQLETPWETVRSGMFIALADWAAKKSQRLNQRFERAWKPDVLVPISSVAELDGKYRFLRGLAFPKGSLQILGVRTGEEGISEARLAPVIQELQREDLFVTACVIEAQDVVSGAQVGASVMQGGFFRPNVLFVDATGHTQEELQRFLDLARAHEMGCTILVQHATSGLGHERRINVWLRDQSPDWEAGLLRANVDLTLLLAYQLSRNWQGELRMLTVVHNPADQALADAALKDIYKNARIPGRELSWVGVGNFQRALGEAPRADLHLFGLGEVVDLAVMQRHVQQTGASCLFVLDSGHESAFA